MDTSTDTFPSQNAPSAPAGHNRKRFVLALIALLIIAIAAMWWWMSRPAPLEPGADRPIDLPVAAPEIDSMDDVAAMTQGKPVPPEFPGIVLPPFVEGDHIYGEQAAAVSVVEYTNFGNVYAGLLHPDLKAYVDASGGGVNWVFRHYPLSDADYLPAQAAECAYFQKDHQAFWLYMERNFKGPWTAASLKADAAAMGLDPEFFDRCLDEGTTRDHVLGNAQDARLDAKIRVGPSYVIVNNATGEVRLVEGVNTIDYIEKTVEAID